jgi:hypothetical protein
LRHEASNLLALDDRLAGNGVEEAGKDGWAMAAAFLSDTVADGSEGAEDKDSHSRDDPTVLPDFGRNFLELRSMGVVNQSSMPCRCKEDAIL